MAIPAPEPSNLWSAIEQVKMCAVPVVLEDYKVRSPGEVLKDLGRDVDVPGLADVIRERYRGAVKRELIELEEEAVQHLANQIKEDGELPPVDLRNTL